MIFRQEYGIDLGSDAVKIYAVKRDTIIKEKNMIAVIDGDSYLAAGNGAYEMYEKTPDNIRVSVPMADGMIADITHLEIILYTLLKKTGRFVGRDPLLFFTVPTDMTEIEKRAYYSLARVGDLRKSKVYLVHRPIADAVALGISIKTTKGEMIVNIGAQSTEISVLADARVILSRVCPLGGSTLDQAIMDDVRRKQQLFIGHRTAIRLKTSMADLGQDKKEARKAIGISAVTGLPKEIPVTEGVVSEACRRVTSQIAEEIRTIMERTPPQVREYVQKEGFHLTGGTSALPGIDRYLADELGCPVVVSQFSDEGTIHGLREILLSHDLRKAWAFPAKKQKRKKQNYL